MSYNVKNYTEQGGEKTVIGGELEVRGTLTVKDGAIVAGIVGAATSTELGGIKAATKDSGYTVEVKIDATSSKLYVPTYPTVPVGATTETAGIVKMAANVATIAGETVTAENFNALINALVTAGLMASGASGG